ncbi:conserved hypothetical protein [Uncinocarpus reesii 1704]|uniref:DUF159 domain protein n=1 Tax=Uncinocarpus reesii (strain UAMH 1704) TaxID=336963 RepID=C4JRS8_UNCRE|nr:uncharacterized protein UREG_05167 [Uncinocarpus reesii 1704]EEP80325.1 conserved hypothetical protein [Uncinocarpus reesii 1704]
MCGRYALGVRLAFIRHQLQQQGQPVDDAPDDDEVRETYNFAPGYFGPVYRADTPDQGGYDPAEAHDGQQRAPGQQESETTGEPQDSRKEGGEEHVRYKLQSMKWGLIPFWTKRSPDYGSLMRTINCRDDSLAENKGMWTSMKKRKRCVVICQGFYEWLKKGKEKMPHFIRRKDGNLMCFAGLWDCVKYEGSDEKLYTYTVITTSSNAYLNFIHDRMPVILEPGSAEMAAWLDPHRTTWTKELQSMLKPYEGELEAYPVNKDVGKVGNNSPDFIIPINSKENKKNIANFFANTQKKAQGLEAKPKLEPPAEEHKTAKTAGIKREHDEETDVPRSKVAKTDDAHHPSVKLEASSPTKPAPASARKTRSATSNNTTAGKPGDTKRTAHGNQRITNFFKK